ncbi:MAG: hypothetical protein ACR2IK_05665 [Chloroflexota bacterium]
MTITITSEDSRSIKAIEIAAGASQWLKCKTADGAKAYGIPSSCQPGRFYLVTCSTCDCQDAQRHPIQACKHQLGVRLHCELVKAQLQQPRRRLAQPANIVDLASRRRTIPAREEYAF